jgi:paraquat-inducible protein B
MKAAETLIASEETAQLPASLASALDEIRAALKELREGGAIENTNTALASASRAADALAASTQDLPALVVRMNRVLGQASATLQSYDANSDVNRGARDALRDIQKAADAIANLARTIQRNPNSLLLGR